MKTLCSTETVLSALENHAGVRRDTLLGDLFPDHDVLKKLDCRFPFSKPPTLDAETIESLKTIKNPMDHIYETVQKTLGELLLKPVPAHLLNDEQKFALLWAAGLLKYEDGKFVSICKVSFASARDGRYIIGRRAASNPDH